jgi:hypothetical protein
MLRYAAAVVISVSLAACGSFGGALPSPGPTPTPSGIAASDKNGPVEVAAMLFPDGGTACGHSGDFSSCPVTRELKQRLAARPIQYVDQLCRCTGRYRSPRFTPMPASDETVVRVDLTLDAGQQSLEVVVTHPYGVWVASDVTCAGRGTSTSVFSDSPTLCFASSG